MTFDNIDTTTNLPGIVGLDGKIERHYLVHLNFGLMLSVVRFLICSIVAYIVRGSGILYTEER